MVGLVLSGVTAFPLATEAALLVRVSGTCHLDTYVPELASWIDRVHHGLTETGQRYPFLSYGTDWLAFAHIVLAIAFLGPWIDPVRNRWVILFGLIACFGVLPLAFIAGPLRGIPLYWRLIDCSFGVFGSIPLWIVLVHIRSLELLQKDA